LEVLFKKENSRGKLGPPQKTTKKRTFGGTGILKHWGKIADAIP